LVLQKLFKKNT